MKLLRAILLGSALFLPAGANASSCPNRPANASVAAAVKFSLQDKGGDKRQFAIDCKDHWTWHVNGDCMYCLDQGNPATSRLREALGSSDAARRAANSAASKRQEDINKSLGNIGLPSTKMLSPGKRPGGNKD